MFLHGGWLHFLGNMLYLWIFGDNVEDRLGHGLYLVLLSRVRRGGRGCAGARAPVLADADGRRQRCHRGRHGGVLRALPALTRPGVIFFVFFLDVVEIPAIVFLGVWFLMQLFSGVGSVVEAADGGVAFMAHVGGFAAGC